MIKTILFLTISVTLGSFAAPVSTLALQYTEIGDTISGILTPDKSPYLVTSTLIVPPNRVLTVKPGVILTFKRSAKLKVDGHLECIGDLHNTIRLTAEQSAAAPGGWEGIYFTDIASKGTFSYCVIEYSTAGIYCELASDVTIDHCILRDNRLYGIYCIGYASPTITNNVIDNSNYGVVCYDYSSPEITGNTIRNTQLAGIYCFICSNPHIEGNVITRNKGVGIFCLDMSMPLVENNLITRNMNGIRCTNASPFIMRNTVSYNDYFGVACVNSSAQIVYNNIFGNSLYNIDVLERDFIMPAGNWWGDDAYMTVAGKGTGQLAVRREKVNGPIALDTPSPIPIDIGVGSPKQIKRIELRVEPDEGRNDLAHVGDRLLISVYGTDGSSITRDHVPVVMQHIKNADNTIRMLAVEDGDNTGMYTGTIELGERASQFVRTRGWQSSEQFKIYCPGFEAASTSFHLVNRRPEITSFIIKGANGRLKTTARNPITFTWTYPDYGDEKILDRPVNLEVSTEETFNRNSRILLQELTGSSTSYTCAPGMFKEGRLYFARLRMRDFDSWKTNKTITIRINRPPAPPEPVFPKPGEVLTQGLWANPIVLPAADPDKDVLTYEFEMYADSAKVALVNSGTGRAANGQIIWKPGKHLEENATYWWRACADDGYDRTWSPLHRFSVNMEDEPIRPFSLTQPGQDALLGSGSVTFQWEDAVDPDPSEKITYTFWLSSSADFKDKIEIDGIHDTRYRLDRTLEKDKTYYWKVMAANTGDATQWCNTKVEPFGRFRIGTPRSN